MSNTVKDSVLDLQGQVGEALKCVHDTILLLGKDVIDLDAENMRLRFEVERLEKALAEQPKPEIPPALLKSKSIKSFKTETILEELQRRGYILHYMP